MTALFKMIMRMRIVPAIIVLASVGCHTVRPIAQHGVGLAENTERAYPTRVSAHVGALVGGLAGVPFMVILLPTLPFEGAWGWGVREPQPPENAAVAGDFTTPLCLVPLEFGRGIGAAVLGSPAGWIEDSVTDVPRPPGWVDEVQESASGGGLSVRR